MDSLGLAENGGEAKISNLNFSLIPIDEDIVAFEISVDHRRIMAMEVDEPHENLPAPMLYCPKIYLPVSQPIPTDRHKSNTVKLEDFMREEDVEIKDQIFQRKRDG